MGASSSCSPLPCERTVPLDAHFTAALRIVRRQPVTSSRQVAATFARDDDVESDDENDSAKMSHAQSLKRGTQVSPTASWRTHTSTPLGSR